MSNVHSVTGYFELTAHKNGETIILKFSDLTIAQKSKRELKRRGYECVMTPMRYRIETDVEGAVHTARLACRDF